MIIKKEQILEIAEETGYAKQPLEKVLHLMGMLNDFASDSFLKGRVVLKGGTALNLFFGHCHRLSVDIDINYIASAERTIMLAERQTILDRIEKIGTLKGYTSHRKPKEHAGGKWTFRYQSALQGLPRLDIDVNFLSRVPLWPITQRTSVNFGHIKVDHFPILDIHELAGGKLTALVSRSASRDLFDAHRLLSDKRLDREKLRLAFVMYGAMSRKDLRLIRANQLSYDWSELCNMLLPMLSNTHLQDINTRQWANQLRDECQEQLQQLLLFTDNETAFLDFILNHGEIRPEFLTQDKNLIEKIRQQPGLHWKSIHVKKQLEAGSILA